MASLAAVPCQTCRSRKSKCNRRMPTCGYCAKASLRCDYVGVASKPGLRAGYVHRLEERLEALEGEIAELKRSMTGHHPTSARPPTASPQIVTPSRPVPATAAASLSSSPVSELLWASFEFWYRHYHPWLPILHKPSLRELVLESAELTFSTLPVVLKAMVVAATTENATSSPVAMPDRQSMRLQLKSEMLLDCLRIVSCANLQGLLMLAAIAFGEGNLPEFWHLMSLCKRTSMQLGLRDLVVHYGDNYDQPSTLPPRMLLVPSTDVDLEERVRAFWVTETFDSASTVGASWNLPLSAPELGGLSPCGDDDWNMPLGQVRMFASSMSDSPSAFGLYVQTISNHIWHVHKFHQEVSDLTDINVYTQRQIYCQTIDEALLRRSGEIAQEASGVSPLAASSTATRTSVVSNVNIVLNQCVIHMATITLFQGMFLTPTTSDQDIPQPWKYAALRCLSACDHIVSTLRDFPDDQLGNASPQVSVCLFVAARFYIIYARSQQAQASPRVHFLLYSLQCSGQMWKLAKRLYNTLNAALSPARRYVGDDERPLPAQFWDFRYSWQDIDHALQLWDAAEPSFLGS